jgi:NAD(P)-dependent dehydrogenase (short-subunit alcohol dehydrogenase family)
VRFEGKVVVVFGGAGGIGSATARKFAAESAHVVIADIDHAAAAEVARSINPGDRASAAAVDVSDYSNVDAVVNQTVARYGRLDVVFNCAAIVVRRPLLEHEPPDFERVMRVNVDGTFNGILAASRAMRELRTRGCIVNTASIAGYMAAPSMIGYQASKGAVRSLTQTAALELAPLGIRVVAVAPGAVDTPLLAGAAAAGLDSDLARRQMRRKMIAPEKVADVVLFLASDEADAINGTTVLVDDGYVSFK